MVDTIAPSVIQITDANGDPVPGAKARFYDTGTTTPRTVYSDVGGVTPHASPVVADANGILPPIYATVAVKMAVTTAADVAVPGYPVDPANKVSATGSAASAISYSPHANNPATDVQDAIDNISDVALRPIVAGNGISVTDGDGVGGDPTVAITLGTAGHVLAMNAAGSATAFRAGVVWGTPQATTSGSAIDFTGIPAWATVIYVALSEVSPSGTDSITVQIGDAGGIETTGYVSSRANLDNGASVSVGSSTIGFPVGANSASQAFSGVMVLTQISVASNGWCSMHSGKYLTTGVSSGGGIKNLSATLDRVRITLSGANTFDNGSVNVGYC